MTNVSTSGTDKWRQDTHWAMKPAHVLINKVCTIMIYFLKKNKGLFFNLIYVVRLIRDTDADTREVCASHRITVWVYLKKSDTVAHALEPFTFVCEVLAEGCAHISSQQVITFEAPWFDFIVFDNNVFCLCSLAFFESYGTSGVCLQKPWPAWVFSSESRCRLFVCQQK